MSEYFLYDFKNKSLIDPLINQVSTTGTEFGEVIRNGRVFFKRPQFLPSSSFSNSIEKAKSLVVAMDEFKDLEKLLPSKILGRADYVLKKRKLWLQEDEVLRQMLASIGPVHMVIMEDYRWTHELYELAHAYCSGRGYRPPLLAEITEAQEQFFKTPTRGQFLAYLSAAQLFRKDPYYGVLTEWMRKTIPEVFQELQGKAENSLLELELFALWEIDSGGVAKP